MNALLLSLFLQLAAPAAQARELVASAPVDTTAAVSIHARIWPDTVFVGQQALYQLIVFVDERSRDRVRRMEAIPPEMRAMLAYEAPQRSGTLPSRVIGGRRFETYIYQRPIFPLAAGQLTVPPSRLVYAMPVSASFFSRVESMELWSDSTRVVVLDPPPTDRPAGFGGAVGHLRIEAELDTAAARVGDPLTLTVRVVGRGNVKLFPRPDLDIPWASAVTAGDRIEQGPDSLAIGGTKEFRWVLTPRQAGRQELPPIRYPYFDPEGRRFEIAETRPRFVMIAPGALARLDTAETDGARVLEVRTVFRGALPSPVHERMLFWIVLAIAPLPAVVLAARRRPVRRRRPRRPPPGARIEALDGRRAPPAETRRAFLGACAERLSVPAVMLGDPAAFQQQARRAGVTARTAREGAELVAGLNQAAFGPDALPLSDARDRALRIFSRIDREAVRRRWRNYRPLVIVGLAGGSLALSLGSAHGEREAIRFGEGVSAYHAGAYGDAMLAFEDVVRRVPRAADAWANLGTAAYAAADTARATWGWQRALRLEPLARDVRDRMAILSAGYAGAGVPPIPATWMMLVAGGVWLIGWGLAALRCARRDAWGSSAIVTTIIALLAAGAAWSIDRRVAGNDLVVLARAEPLRFLPALASDPSGTIPAGGIARVEAIVGGWVQLSYGARTGWVERSQLLPLARD